MKLTMVQKGSQTEITANDVLGIPKFTLVSIGGDKDEAKENLIKQITDRAIILRHNLKAIMEL